MRAVFQLPVWMSRPQRQGYIVEADNLDLVEVVFLDDVLDVPIAPVRRLGGVVDSHTLQLHGVGVPFPGPVPVRGGEVLRSGLSPKYAHSFSRLQSRRSSRMAVMPMGVVVAGGVRHCEVLQEFESSGELTLKVRSSKVSYWIILYNLINI